VAKNYTAPLWMTYKQAESLGAHVRKMLPNIEIHRH